MNVTIKIQHQERPTQASRLTASDDWTSRFGTRPLCISFGGNMINEINDMSSAVGKEELSRSKENYHDGAEEFDTMADSSSMTELQASNTGEESNNVQSSFSLIKSNGSATSSSNLNSGSPVDSKPHPINQGLMSDDCVSASQENVGRPSTIIESEGRSNHVVATISQQGQPAPAPVSAPLNIVPPNASNSSMPLSVQSEFSVSSAVAAGLSRSSKERTSSESLGPSSSTRGTSYTNVGIPIIKSFEKGVRRRTSSDPIRDATQPETSAVADRSPPTSQTISEVAVHTTVINSLQPKVPQQPLPPPVAKAITSSNSHTTSYSTNIASNVTRHLPAPSSPGRLDDDKDGEHDIVEQSPQSRYVRFQEKLGSGAYKDVYRAYDTIEGIEVAWNQVNLAGIPKTDKARIINEVRLLERLHHPNIISFHGSWVNREREQVVFVTEILSSGTLKSFVNKVKVVRWRIAKRWAIQILKGLEYLHSQDPPIIHRDLKCDNIFINGTTGDLRIGDLGLSTVISSKSKVLSVLGTPEFMAPELYDESYDEKVDIYAFGMCMLEIFTKEVPYKECHNPAQIYKKVTNGIPPSSLARVKSISAREFIQLCLGTLPDANGEFRRPSATELLQHPFLQKNPDDEMEVEVLPAVEESILEERSSIANSLPEDLDSASISSLLPPIPGTSLPAQIPRAESGDVASLDNSTTPGFHQEGSMTGHAFRSSVSSDPLPAQLLPRSAMQQPPMNAISVPVETDAEDDDANSDHLRNMPVDEGNMRKVTVMMGRDQVLEEDDEIPALASTSPGPPSALVPPPPAASPGPTQVQISNELNRGPSPKHNEQPQPPPKPQIQHQPQQLVAPVNDRGFRNDAAQRREQKVVQPREPHQAQMHQQQYPNIPDASRQQSQMLTGQQGQLLGQQQRQQVRHQKQESTNGPSVRHQTHQPVQGDLPGQDSVQGDGGRYGLQPKSHPQPAPVVPQSYPVSPFGGEPVEEEVMKLILTLPFEGKTSNVQFDFHLIEDDPVQVAREMVTELGIPESAVLEISETISGLARAARIKQQEDKKLVMQGAKPSHITQQHISPNQPTPQQLNASSQTAGHQMPPVLPTGSGNQQAQLQALQSQQHKGALSVSPHEQKSQHFGARRSSNAEQGLPPPPQQIHASRGQTQMHHGHQAPQPGLVSNLQPPYPGQVQNLQSHQIGVGQSHPNTQQVVGPPNLQASFGQTQQSQHGMGQLRQNMPQGIGQPRQNATQGIGQTHVPVQNPNLSAAVARNPQGHVTHETFQAHDLQRASRSFDGEKDKKFATSHYTMNPAVGHPEIALQYQDQEMNGKRSHAFGDHDSSASLPVGSVQDVDNERAHALKHRPKSVPSSMDHVEDDVESFDGHQSFDESDSVSSTGESQEELRRMEEEFQKSMQRAKKVYESRMENLTRSLNEFESQHIQNMKKHEKEKADFEKKAKFSEVEYNKRLKDLEDQWNQKKAEMIRKKHEGRNAVKKVKEDHVFPPVQEEEKESMRSMSQASSSEFENKEES